MTNNNIIKGSIKDVSKNADTAVALLDAKIVLLCDESGSMSEYARAGKSRHEIEREIVERLQTKHAGQVVLIAFNSTAFLCLDGVLPEPMGDTNMLDAFRKARPLVDAGLRAVLITDGEPSHDEAEVIDAAKPFIGKMDCIFVGPEDSGGQSFCDRLAKAVRGQSAICDLTKDPALLEAGLTQLLLKAGGS